MYNNGFCGGNICWIILLILLFCNCGGNTGYNTYNGCGCERERDHGCGCC